MHVPEEVSESEEAPDVTSDEVAVHNGHCVHTLCQLLLHDEVAIDAVQVQARCPCVDGLKNNTNMHVNIILSVSTSFGGACLYNHFFAV